MNPTAPSGETIGETAVAVRGLSVAYRKGKPALQDVSFTLPSGSHVAVVGPNGAGKTTLFKAMLGLVPLRRGQVELLGRSPAEARPQVAYVPQREAVDWQFPVVVSDVVMMGRVGHIGYGRRPAPEDYDVVHSALARVGLSDYYNTPISDLSGGQQQRVFLARALAQEARLYLLDEPFNEVDTATQGLLLALLDEFVAEGRSVMVATHDLHLARNRFPRVLLLNGRVVALGPPGQVFQPEPLHEAYQEQVVFWQAKADTRELVLATTPTNNG